MSIHFEKLKWIKYSCLKEKTHVELKIWNKYENKNKRFQQLFFIYLLFA